MSHLPPDLVPEKTGFEQIALDSLESAPALRGLSIWHSMRGERRFPARSALRPREIADIMQYMSIVTVVDGGKDFENRFVGDAVVRAHEVPINHRRFSDVAKDMPGLIDGLLPLFRKVVATGQPLGYGGKTGHDLEHVVYTEFQGVLLPFGETERCVDHVVYVGSCMLTTLPHIMGRIF